MADFFSYKILSYIFFAVLIIGAFFLINQLDILFKPLKSESELHYYEVEDFKIRKVNLKIFYFVPKNRKADSGWEKIIKSSVNEIKAFHLKEFKGAGILRTEIYPLVILGLKNAEFYDGDDTSGGNPNALENILKEINERVFKNKGDLYLEDFVKKNNYEMTVKVFIYEGVGATGGHFTVLLAKDYLKTKNFGSTVFYHELMHTFGVPDFYDYQTNLDFSDDIMGSGREKPINETYIRKDIKEKLGYKELSPKF